MVLLGASISWTCHALNMVGSFGSITLAASSDSLRLSTVHLAQLSQAGCLRAAAHRCPSTSSQGYRLQQRMRICAMAKGPPRQGRGYDARKASAEGVRKRMSNKESDQGWVQVAVSDDLIEGKNKAIIHENNGYVIIKRDAALYAIKANCTSCQFPVVDGKVDVVQNDREEDVTIDCPLCHTKVSLVDGKVITWCPKDGPLQWVVGTLKEKAPAVPAKVYPTRQSNSGRLYVRFAGSSELKIP